MRNCLPSLSLILLGVLSVSAGGAAPAPVPVTFGPNIDLSVAKRSANTKQRETTVAVNPRDPNNIVEGNTDHIPNPYTNTFSFTTDGGQTWTFGGPVPLENSTDAAADPALAADADGNFYYSFVDDVISNGGKYVRADLVVAKSTDGGRTFPTFSVALQGDNQTEDPDKDYIAVDAWTGSPFLGNVYVAWTNFGVDRERIQVTVSRDMGQTWSQPMTLSRALPDYTEGVWGALPVTAPDGTVYVFYADLVFVTGPMSISYSKSTDGGNTWSQPADVASLLPSPGFFRLKNNDPNWDTKTLFGIYSNSLPTAAISPDGTISVAWTDFPNGSCVNDGSSDPPCTNADVRLSVSRNAGKSWTLPVKVSDDTDATDQFFPWIAAHPNGLLSLAWNDKRLDPNNVNYDEFYTNTFNGATFLTNVRITTTTALSGKGQTPINDYNGLAVSADGIIPVWAQMTSATADIYTAVGHFVK